MQIKNARFLKSMKSRADYPSLDMPEIAICGKSNVGKSTLVNYLTNNSKLAKTSSSPGKTRLVNFFVVNEEFLLVDLPGYGFARVSKSEQKSWSQMIEGYLSESKQLRALMILLDIRHNPTADDKMMFEWAAHFGISVIIVATKADKIAKTKRYAQLQMIKKSVSGGVDYPIVAVSSQNRFGAESLLDEIEKALTI
jgi:GTP-binding protein